MSERTQDVADAPLEHADAMEQLIGWLRCTHGARLMSVADCLFEAAEASKRTEDYEDALFHLGERALMLADTLRHISSTMYGLVEKKERQISDAARAE